MAETISTEPPRHQSGGLAMALAKLDLDALTVSDAVADVAGMAGENVTTALRADFKELRAEVNARIDTLTSETNAQFREVMAGAEPADPPGSAAVYLPLSLDSWPLARANTRPEDESGRGSPAQAGVGGG